MEFQKEIAELIGIIEEIKESVNIPLEATTSSKESPLTVEDMEVLLKRTQEIIDKLNIKADDICNHAGVSREEMARMSDDPSNFKPQEWEAIEAMRGQVDAFHKSLMHAMFQQKNERIVSAGKDDVKRKPLKGKRNWMPL